jgi:hypothetical protein
MLNRDDIMLTRALERCEVPPAGFPHASHLHVAWVYLNESASLDEAVERMGATLRRFAAAVGKAEKYSELDTVLRAYPRLLDKNLMRASEAPHVIAPGSTDSSSDAPDRALSGRSA